jgi:hypothetical protein
LLSIVIFLSGKLKYEHVKSAISGKLEFEHVKSAEIASTSDDEDLNDIYQISNCFSQLNVSPIDEPEGQDSNNTAGMKM